MIDLTKKYCTRDGREVAKLHLKNIYTVNYPIGGYVDISNLGQELVLWTSAGEYWSGEESKYDLVEVVEDTQTNNICQTDELAARNVKSEELLREFNERKGEIETSNLPKTNRVLYTPLDITDGCYEVYTKNDSIFVTQWENDSSWINRGAICLEYHSEHKIIGNFTNFSAFIVLNRYLQSKELIVDDFSATRLVDED